MVTAVQRDHTVYVPDAPELDIKMVKRINAMFCAFSTIRKSDGAATYGEPGVSCVASGQRVGLVPLWALVLGSSCPVPLPGNGEGMGCPRPRRGPRGHAEPGRPDRGAGAAHQARTRGLGRARAGVACWGHQLILMLTPHQESQLGSGGEKLIGFGAKTETQSSGGCGNDGGKV